MDAELVLGHLLHLLADVAGEEFFQMVGIAEEIGGGEDGPFGDLIGDVLRRDVAHLQIAALEGDELGALLEQRAAIIGLQLEVAGDRLAEHLHHLGADVLLGKDGREAEDRLVLSRGDGCDRCGGHEHGTGDDGTTV